MKTTSKKSIPCFFILCCCFILSCNQDYNPFEDQRNTRLSIRKSSIVKNDTLTIFSRESIVVSIAVPQFAESLTITAQGNRLFQNGKSLTYSFPEKKTEVKSYVIPFSFVDTGNVIISLQLNKEGGTESEIVFPCYVRTPLTAHQITGNHRDGFELKTGAVKDSDIVYQWYFEGYKNVETVSTSVKGIKIENLTEVLKGSIMVSDGYHKSQPVAFMYEFADTYKPDIAVLNKNVLRGDTILCTPRSLQVAFVITDTGCGVADSVLVNGASVKVSDGFLFKEFNEPIDSIIVLASDKSRNRNTRRARFFMKVDSTILGQSAFQFSIIAPADSSVSTNSIRQIFGEARVFGGKDTLNHKVVIALRDSTQEFFVKGGTQRYWQATVMLRDSINKLSIQCKDIAGNILNSRGLIIFHRPDQLDINPPVIVDISVGNSRKSLSSQTIVTSDVAHVSVIAYDQETDVDSVLIDRLLLKKGIADYLWEGTVNLTKRENDLKIRAFDKNKKYTDINKLIIKNSSPVYSGSLKQRTEIVAGSIYSDTLKVTDPDGDRVYYKIDTSIVKGASIDLNGVITWHTTKKDTGSYVIHCFADDTYEQVVATTNVVIASDSAKLSRPVKFKTLLNDFPQFIDVGSIFRLQLKHVYGTGGKAVLYDVKSRIDITRQFIKNDTLVIKPELTDTGYVQMMIIVNGDNLTCDTLFPVVRVVPVNLPPKIIPDSSMYTGGRLQLIVSSSGSLYSFPFKIMDPESSYTVAPVTELRCKNSNVNLSKSSDRSYQIKIVSGHSVVSIDTIVLWCTDHRGLQDSLKIPVFFTNRGELLTVISPKFSDVIMDDTIIFSWNKSRSILNPLYIVEYGMSIDSVYRKLTVSDTSVAVRMVTSGLYFWRVYMKDGLSSAVVPFYTFRLRVPGHIEFKTSGQDIRKIIYAGIDSLMIRLELVEHTGLAPVKITGVKIHARDTTAVSVSNMGLYSWAPTVHDTGNYQFVFIATDANNNRDTLQSDLQIIPVQEFEIDVSSSTPGFFDNESISFFGETTSALLKIKVVKIKSSAADTFNIKVVSLRYSVDLDADSVVLKLSKPSPLPVTNDTIHITVTSKNGKKIKTRAIVIKYVKEFKKVIVDTRDVMFSGSIENIPVLIRLDSSNFSFGTTLPGFKFQKSNSSDTFPYQVNSWDPVLKMAEIWVLYDKIKAGTLDTLLMYHGAPLTDRSNGYTVFDTANNYCGVWHLEERKPFSNLLPFTIKDATYNENSGSAYFSNYDSTGCIGAAKKFNSFASEFITLSKPIGYKVSTKSATIESWVKGSSLNGTIISIKAGSLASCNLTISAGMSSLYFSSLNKRVSGEKVSIHDWNYVSATVNINDTVISGAVFCNGISTPYMFTSSTIQLIPDSCTIGVMYDRSSSLFDGSIDDVRVSGVSRSNGWMHFSYENQKPNSTIVQVKD